jgi:hypothetical protein
MYSAGMSNNMSSNYFLSDLARVLLEVLSDNFLKEAQDNAIFYQLKRSGQGGII